MLYARGNFLRFLLLDHTAVFCIFLFCGKTGGNGSHLCFAESINSRSIVVLTSLTVYCAVMCWVRACAVAVWCFIGCVYVLQCKIVRLPVSRGAWIGLENRVRRQGAV